MKGSYKNFIGGKWVEAKTKKTFLDRNPADWDDVIGVFPASGAEDVAEAVESAKKGYEIWRKVPPPKRGLIIQKAGELLLARKEEIAKLMTREMGKILDETRGDVQEAIDTAFYMAGEGRRLFGVTTTSELPNKTCMAIRIPIGVAGIISPWNFPIAIPAWKIFPALICGNAVVFKPASDAPAVASKFVEILLEAGVPENVVNLVYGSGSEVGMAIAKHPDVGVVSFTGSSDTGRQLAEVCGKNLKRLSLEMGGKNAQIVLDDADVELAVEGALWGAFGTTGQRCTATSRLILHAKIYDEFLARFVERAKKIKIGNGLKPDTQMGPLINEAQLKKVEKYVKIGLEEGAKLVCGGKRYTKGECAKGFFFEPTVFVNVKPTHRIATEEIFGPVVSVIKVSDLDEAINVLNGTQYGLSSSIYTKDVGKAFYAIREINAGITYVNAPTIGAETHLPFGGTKNTGNGHRESGFWVLDTYSEWKAVYIDYSGTLQRAQIDTYKQEG